jgi:hypothetical protein
MLFSIKMPVHTGKKSLYGLKPFHIRVIIPFYPHIKLKGINDA